MPEHKFTAAIGFKSWREGLAREQTRESLFELDFVEINPIHRAFGPMARDLRFDISEMAVITALQAIAYDKALIVLPVTLAARFQHGCLITRMSDNQIKPGELSGRRVAVRAYTQTTGVWIRGILENDYGVAAASVDWMTQEGAHLSEFKDPPWVQQADSEQNLVSMLRDGAIDAAILGNDLPDDADLAPVIVNPSGEAKAWYRRHHVVPTNHVMVVRRDVAEAHPEAMRALWRCLIRAKPAPVAGYDFAAMGIGAHRAPLEMLLRFCAQQALLPRELTFDEIFAPAKRLLGDSLQD